MNIGKIIKFSRLKQNKTQKELADILGLKSATVSSWEKGINCPSVKLFFKICEVLKIENVYFEQGKKDPMTLKIEKIECEIEILKTDLERRLQ